MMQLIYGGLAGLWLGLTLRWSALDDPEELRGALSLRASMALKTALSFLGFGALLTAFLGWLAVLDVDLLAVPALHGGVIAGGVIFGAAAALCGRVPLTALSGIGGSQPVQSLCVAAGCAAGAALLPFVSDLFLPLQSLPPQLRATLFRVTLDEPYLFQGGFLGQGCTGAVLLALALWVPAPPQAAQEPPAEASEPDAESGEPVVIALEGEEPIVVESPAEDPSEEEEASEEENPPEEDPEPEEDAAEPTDIPEENVPEPEDAPEKEKTTEDDSPSPEDES